jgi:recombination protein RecT
MTDQTLTTPRYTISQLLNSEKFQRDVSKVLPKHITPQRMVQTALNCLNRTPELKECSQASFFAALMKLSEIGLEPDGRNAHLIPFNNNKTKIKEVQLIIDYKGIVTVIRRNPAIAVVKGMCVYEGDEFEYQEGSDRYFHHKPKFLQEKIIGAYSFIKFANINDWEVDFLPLWRINEVRERSRAKDKGPWVTDFSEMAIKTALRHHSKTMPLLPEQTAAIEADDDQFDQNPFERRLPVRPAQIAGKKEETPDDAQTSPAQSTNESVPADGGQSGSGVVLGDEPSKPAAVNDDPPAEVQLERLATANNIEQQEVISALIEHKVPVEDASETGAITDLPQGSVLAAIHGWQKIVFTVNKQRAQKAKK